MSDPARDSPLRSHAMRFTLACTVIAFAAYAVLILWQSETSALAATDVVLAGAFATAATLVSPL